MNNSALKNSSVLLDPVTIAFYLRAPRSHIILLQAYFELYDGLGTVRTLEGDDQVICVLTSKAQEEDCIQMLEAIRDDVHWDIVPASDIPR
jgi:DNA-binding response OmpR family regulator